MPKTLWVLRKKANKMYIILLYINITILKLCCKNWIETNFTNACTPWYVTLFSIKGILELTKKKRFALGKYKLINVIVNEGKGENLSYNFFSNQWSVCHTQPFRGINNTNNRIASIRQNWFHNTQARVFKKNSSVTSQNNSHKRLKKIEK